MNANTEPFPPARLIQSSHSPGLARRALGKPAYAPPGQHAARPIDLRLDANEGPRPAFDPADLARLDPDAFRRYPSTMALERDLAAQLNIDPARVLVTAGGDDAIDRACRAVLEPGSTLVLPVPTFEMIERYALLAGARIVRIAWPTADYPIAQVVNAIDDATSMVAVVSPNNPTGAVIKREQLAMLSVAAHDALILADFAYTEFADDDLTNTALDLPNVLVVRTFSKAFGLAGLRVGYAAGPAPVIAAMRAAASPYPVSTPSVVAATNALERAQSTLPPSIARIREERGALHSLCEELGARPRFSQANFVLADFDRVDWVWNALASLGISVRRFAPGNDLNTALRITCPGDPIEFDRLERALRATLRPDAILFDMDGVLADVSRSYRAAIQQTAETFGVTITAADISRAKAAGHANNDWALTRRLLAAQGVDAPLAEVVDRFELLYQGSPDRPGLRDHETFLIDRPLLARLAARFKLGIVTGRPRADAGRFLARFDIADLFQCVVCMEDAPSKPDPAPVSLALRQLGATSAWLIGDTPDDLRAAKAAGVVPLAIHAPGELAKPTVALAAAATALSSLSQLEGLLP